MATEKILNTRIKLRYDLYSNWSTNNPKLLPGEVALAYVPTGTNNSVSVGEGAVNGTTPPQVLIKVGDGEHRYNDLKYVSALAADVLSVCKSENALKTFINGVIADAGIASSEAMEALAGRVTDTEAAITTLNGNDETEGSVAKAIKDAIEALDLDNTYAFKEHTHVVADITDFATEAAKVKVANATMADEATKATQDGNGKVIADTYAEKATTLVGYGIEDAYTKNETDTAVQGAKDYAKGLVDAIPEQVDYTVTCEDADFDATSDAPAFKRHTLTQNGNTICTIDIPKELVVEAGSVKEVTEEGNPYAEAKVGDKYIELIIANQDEPIYVPAKDLVDIYTAKDGATEVQVAISNTNEISATLVNGGITEEKLAEGVKTKLNKTWEEVGVAAGLVSALENGQVKTNKEAIEAINNETTGILAQAKADAADKAAVVLAEAQAYADQAEADAIADAASKYETKGTAQGIVDALDLANTYQAKGDYATAEQGGKADTAIQSVTSVADNGIKATTEGNAVTIDWDPNIVFVFDCGASEE